MRGIPSPVSAIGLSAGIVLLIAAIAFGRVDIAVTGVVLVVAVVLAIPSRGEEADSARLHIERAQPLERDGDRVIVPLTFTATAPGAEQLVVSLAAQGQRARHIVLAGPSAVQPLGVSTVHSGDQELLAVDGAAIGPDGTWAASFGPARVVRARLEPVVRALRDLPLPRVPSGLTGGHEAPRPGDGGEFRDIHPFGAGDRLRRIDWKATARLARRPGELYVRRMLATSDIDVALVLDDGDDLSGLLASWGDGDAAQGLPTSMDVAREAAWSFAVAYLDRADQVSFQVLSQLARGVPRGAGARHRERLRAAICAVTAQQRVARRRTPIVPPNALVVLMSTFLDDEPLRLAGLWRASGHRVIAVDVLPQLRSERLSREEIAASRLVLGARDDRLADLRAIGADVLAWDSTAAARTVALRAMTRQRRRG